jgi:hypothetical protein
MSDMCDLCTEGDWPVATVVVHVDEEERHQRACPRCAELFQVIGTLVVWDDSETDQELQAVHTTDGVLYYPKTDRDRRVDETMVRVAWELGEGGPVPDVDLEPDSRFSAPLTLRDPGMSDGMRMSHRDGASYLDWVGDVLYGPASANLDMN